MSPIVSKVSQGFRFFGRPGAYICLICFVLGLTYSAIADTRVINPSDYYSSQNNETSSYLLERMPLSNDRPSVVLHRTGKKTICSLDCSLNAQCVPYVATVDELPPKIVIQPESKRFLGDPLVDIQKFSYLACNLADLEQDRNEDLLVVYRIRHSERNGPGSTYEDFLFLLSPSDYSIRLSIKLRQCGIASADECNIKKIELLDDSLSHPNLRITEVQQIKGCMSSDPLPNCSPPKFSLPTTLYWTDGRYSTEKHQPIEAAPSALGPNTRKQQDLAYIHNQSSVVSSEEEIADMSQSQQSTARTSKEAHMLVFGSIVAITAMGVMLFLCIRRRSSNLKT